MGRGETPREIRRTQRGQSVKTSEIITLLDAIQYELIGYDPNTGEYVERPGPDPAVRMARVVFWIHRLQRQLEGQLENPDDQPGGEAGDSTT